MNDQNNIIPFPKPQPTSTPGPKTAAVAVEKPARRWNPSLATTVCSLIAIALATGATNTSFYKKDAESELASVDSRAIASIDELLPEERNAAWEKSVAESLASADVRDVASVSVGHDPSMDENLRYGVLEKYTILRDLKRNEIESIILQDTGAEPTVVANRSEFLIKYGKWMSDKYAFSQLKSSQQMKDRRVESFTVFDGGHNPYATANFELDGHQHLIAFHFEPLH